MLTRGALSQVMSDPSVAARLEVARVYEILHPRGAAADGRRGRAGGDVLVGQRTPAGGGRRPASLRNRAVLYDPEVWPYTPVAEQRHPVLAAQQAAAITRAHHLSLIVAPALDLAAARAARAARCGGGTSA